MKGREAEKSGPAGIRCVIGESHLDKEALDRPDS